MTAYSLGAGVTARWRQSVPHLRLRVTECSWGRTRRRRSHCLQTSACRGTNGNAPANRGSFRCHARRSAAMSLELPGSLAAARRADLRSATRLAGVAEHAGLAASVATGASTPAVAGVAGSHRFPLSRYRVRRPIGRGQWAQPSACRGGSCWSFAALGRARRYFSECRPSSRRFTQDALSSWMQEGSQDSVRPSGQNDQARDWTAAVPPRAVSSVSALRADRGRCTRRREVRFDSAGA